MMIAVSLFPTSVDPERMFSLMNNVKTDKRNCLKVDTTAETMRIHEHCRSNREIDIQQCIKMHWDDKGKRRKVVDID